MDEEELEGLVWDWKEKSENSVSSSLKKFPVVGDGRALDKAKRGESRRAEGVRFGGSER